ncbi:MAG TPA: S53 family peptidase, partial [Candidatus Acidoferrum sp.]
MFCKLGFFAAVVLASLAAVSAGFAQQGPGPRPRPRITQSVDEASRVPLHGNTRPEATPANDRGAVADDFPLEHMLLQLKHSPEQEQALQQFIDELHNQDSPNFHHWLTAREFGEKFGVAKSDLDTLVAWLESDGFRVNVVYPSGMLIDFSGTAAQVRKAFQTEIHRLEVHGERYVGNLSDPRIPAALAPVVEGIVSLHDFRPRALHHLRTAHANFTFTDNFGGTNFAVVPADLATIYNLKPLFSAGYSGQGQAIVLIEDTDVFSAADWNTFRSTFGLSSYTSGSFTSLHPAPSSGPNNCGAPGVIAPNDAEAILDAEWASAAAPSSAIVMAACADTTTTFGGLIAMQNLLNAPAPPALMSISYGQCETVNGAAANASYNSTYQLAVTEGVSVFVAAGDSGAAGCDNSAAAATDGIAVNAFASTPYNVAVGGTDFSDTFSNSNGTYWNSSNSPTFGSALSYIPEIPWNNSCAGALLAQYEGFAPYGPNSLCNDPTLGSLLQTTVAGGGGPSACATGTPSTSSVVSGTCQGWPKPSWQSVLGNPSDGVRDTPDVSLFAADGLWGHFYVFCWSDTKNGGAACGSDPSVWSGAGGTSFASPIMAGIQALVNQKTGSRQGNPNPAYYQLAASEYGPNGSSSCNSGNGNNISAACIFYDVTQGDMAVNCTGNFNCFLDGTSSGVLSTSNDTYQPAYGTTAGWDFATGIGTVNAANLVNNWPSSTTPPSFLLSASPASLTILQGASGSATISISPLNGFSGGVSLTASGLPNGVSAAFGTNPATASSLLILSAAGAATTGTFTVTVTGTSGGLTATTTLAFTVNPQGNYTLSASPNSLTIVEGAGGASTITVTPQNGFNSNVTLSASGLPAGVTASLNPGATTSSSTLTLTATSTAATGTVSVTITGTAGNLTNATTVSLTVSPPPTFTLSASPNTLTVTQGSSGTSTITVNPLNGFNGSVALSASDLPNGVIASFNPGSTTSTSTVTLSASSTATAGTSTITVTGTAGSLTKTTAVSLTVRLMPTLPSVWSDGDIGSVGVAGSASYANGTFAVSGAGQGTMITSADGFHFVYQPLIGDGTIVARVVSVEGSSAAQAGIMIRETLSAGANHAYLFDYSSSLLMT